MKQKSSNTKNKKSFPYFFIAFCIFFFFMVGSIGHTYYKNRQLIKKYDIIEPTNENKPPYPVRDLFDISNKVDALKKVDAVQASDLFIKETDKYFKNICTDKTCHHYKINTPKESLRFECSWDIKQIDIIPFYLRMNTNHISMMLYRATFADNSQLIYKTTLDGVRFDDWISLTGFSIKKKDGQYYAYSGKEIDNASINRCDRAISLAFENICYDKDLFETSKNDKKLWQENQTK